LEGERETIDLQQARVFVPTLLNQPIVRLIHSNSRGGAALSIFDLRRRPLVSGTCPRYEGKPKSFRFSSFYEERDQKPRQRTAILIVYKQAVYNDVFDRVHRPKTYFNSHCQVKCTTETVRQFRFIFIQRMESKLA